MCERLRVEEREMVQNIESIVELLVLGGGLWASAGNVSTGIRANGL